MDEPIIIERYNPHWAAMFAEEQLAICAALNLKPDSIHHVGSTAISGMAAKPIIDIAVEIPAYPPGAAMICALAKLGYEHRGEGGVNGRHWFSKGRPRSHHVHVVARDGEVVRRLLCLRDWLRVHAEDAETYERLKREAAVGQTIDSSDYAEAKTKFIGHILGAATASAPQNLDDTAN